MYEHQNQSFERVMSYNLTIYLNSQTFDRNSYSFKFTSPKAREDALKEILSSGFSDFSPEVLLNGKRYILASGIVGYDTSEKKLA